MRSVEMDTGSTSTKHHRHQIQLLAPRRLHLVAGHRLVVWLKEPPVLVAR